MFNVKMLFVGPPSKIHAASMDMFVCLTQIEDPNRA